MVKKLFYDWKVHLLCIIFVVIAEFIGIRPVVLGPLKFSLLPMLYVLAFGIIMAILKLIPKDTMNTASPYTGIATLWLITKIGSQMGPNLNLILKAGPALIFQEFGNLGTIFLSIPLAVFVFNMGRQAIGSGFSNSREGSLALIGSMYGLDSPEGQGVMGSYITGTILGTIFFSLLASFFASIGIFHPYSLAMAAGTGSASMMAASTAPLVEAFPDMAEQITVYAGTSNLLSTVDGLYLSLFLGIPLSKWLYKVLKGEERNKKAEEKRAAKRGIEKVAVEQVVAEAPKASDSVKQSYSDAWIVRAKVLICSGGFALIANTINTYRAGNMVSPLGGLLAMVLMFIPIVLGYLVDDLLKAKAKFDQPTLLYVSIFAIIMGLPFFPGNQIFVAEAAKIGLLPLCTPILAYAGISIGKDLDGFKRQGFGIVCVTIMAFIGTYIGSAIIAEIVLKIQGII